ncbi:MAG: EVE domain-containing protein [Oligoflexales bacterium]
MNRYWIGVVSEEHVRVAQAEGFAQFCHGKIWPVKKLDMGDWIIYYSPKIRMNHPEPCKSFTAIGEVIDNIPYQIEQFPGFDPYRRNIRYCNTKNVPIQEMMDCLEFIKKTPNWGLTIRRGFFEISASDFSIISKRMVIE